ncbi:MAG: hypothetical protein A2Z91_00035 [Deltaproteobacteria bacterium GWA2_38_16]|nr:MAG: hypothetical protein A2Z91_00035 [Deltaproteobacteria bacterium GWA2_38_16]OGQ03495.1 MAG: hypothetical protein A3D19_01440 [Deltaproteobacteria bacterium RIFCSPHIGHO2_02_FULL_38_15]OGQ30375.1 MAG: hypothetical protein A3A72_01660 [Deltaproteobacteria bacterium RIFCSPLOWO2_01_FULL_38_9]OGQ58834.1 MAG: hypothetical protein A3G92_00805 [Deltaproteobacteria bacterium RIFCSPLOWO2_12_FULL_38_8]
MSLAQLAQKGKIKSKAHIKLVCDGKRNLSAKTIPTFSTMLGLKSKEADFFENLVYFTQAHTCEEQLKYRNRLKDLSKTSSAKQIEFEKFDLFSKWYIVALRELVELSDFKEDPKWINSRLKANLTPTEIKKALEILIKLGFLERKNNQLHQTTPKISSGDELRSKAIRHFHYQMLDKAKEALDEDMNHRETSGLTIAMTEEEFKMVKEKIIEFRKSLNESLGTCPTGTGPKNHLYHVALTCFRLTKGGNA